MTSKLLGFPFTGILKPLGFPFTGPLNPGGLGGCAELTCRFLRCSRALCSQGPQLGLLGRVGSVDPNK